MAATGAASEEEALGIMFGRFANRLTEKGAKAGQEIAVRSSDIFISTPVKCGTTWLQQICHQLRSGGDMDFQEICDVAPCIEMATDIGQDPSAEQPYEPRLFKTHFWEPDTPKGGRYIAIARHPHDAAVSFFKFVENWMFAPGEISADTFIQTVFLGMGEPRALLDFPSWYHHTVSWWPRRHDPNVLFLFYEDLREDLEGQVKRIADYMGISDLNVMTQAVEKSTFAFMKEHEDQFDENRFKQARNELCGVPKEAGKGVGKVRRAGGERHLMSGDTKAALDARWEKICLPVFGAATYEEWRSNWHKELKAKEKAASKNDNGFIPYN